MKKFSLLIVSLTLVSFILTSGTIAYNKKVIGEINQEKAEIVTNSDQPISLSKPESETKTTKPTLSNNKLDTSAKTKTTELVEQNSAQSEISQPMSVEINNASSPSAPSTPSTPTPPSTPPKQESFTEKPTEKKIVNLSIQGVGEYPVDWQEGDTAWKIMQRAVSQYHFAMSYQEFSIGIYISSLGGKETQGTYYWALYYNGSYSMLGVSDLPVQPNDSISWKYESWM